MMRKGYWAFTFTPGVMLILITTVIFAVAFALIFWLFGRLDIAIVIFAAWVILFSAIAIGGYFKWCDYRDFNHWYNKLNR